MKLLTSAKRVRRRGRYFIVLKVGKKTVSTRRWSPNFTVKDAINEKIGAKNIKISSRKALKNIKKIKSISKFTKKNTISRLKLTNVIETESRNPLRRKKSVLQIRFEFRKDKIIRQRTGRSNRMFFPSGYNEAFNQCLQRAMAQNLNFSPNEIIIIDKRFIHWGK